MTSTNVAMPTFIRGCVSLAKSRQGRGRLVLHRQGPFLEFLEATKKGVRPAYAGVAGPYRGGRAGWRAH